MMKHYKKLILMYLLAWGFILVGSSEEALLTGTDVLEGEGFKVLAGKRVGLITNHTGVNRKGISVIDLLHASPKVKLMALFSPEHGIRGQADHGVQVASSRDEKTGLVVHSLYSNHRTRPTDEMLRGLDALVFDIQDVGARFYTYITTMAYAMEEAKKHDIQFFVLDRPNPVNGLDVEGPILDRELLSFEGYFPMPLRHGMTMGEMAQLFNKENKIDADLHVIKMKGWHRASWYDQTGLLWINPSPNIRSLTEATTYMAVEPLKWPGLSVGRGTDTPFEMFGAPWIDGIKLAERLNARRIAGARFVPVRFTPRYDKFGNALCGGVNLIVIDRSVFRPVSCSVEIASLLYQFYPHEFEVEKFDKGIGSRSVVEQIKQGIDPKRIVESWQPELKRFFQLRRKYLLYD